MAAIVKSARSPVLAARLKRLRFQVMEADLAVLVGRNIRAARLAHSDRPNGRELAEMLKEVDPQRAPNHQRVSDWERGVQKPDDRYMKALARVLDRPIDWFYRDHAEASSETPEPLSPSGAAAATLDTIQAALKALDVKLTCRAGPARGARCGRASATRRRAAAKTGSSTSAAALSA